MNPAKVQREQVTRLTDLPNVGAATAQDLHLLGIHTPEQLIGVCPYELYQRLCAQTGVRHDACVIDVFISITRFMAGDSPQAWWYYTNERKQALQAST